MRILAALLVVALRMVACTAVRHAGAPHHPEVGPRNTVQRLAAMLRARDFANLPGLFAPECRAGCRGFIVVPTAEAARRALGQWMPRVDEGDLLSDLVLALRPYRHLDDVRLDPLDLRVFHREAVGRARLTVRGRDESGRALSDEGLVDIRLRQTPAGWRISSLAPARVERAVTFLEGEVAERPAPTEQPSAGVQPPASRPEEPRSSPALEARDLDFWAMTGVAPGGAVALSRLAGQRATLLLLATVPCPSCEEQCRWLAALTRGLPGAKALGLILGSGRGLACELPWLAASPDASRALAPLRGLLPMVVLLDARGRAVRMASGATGRAAMENDLARLVPR